MSASLPEQLGLTVVEGPQRVGSELRWRVLDDGRPAVLGQLLAELAHDPSLRRRYVRDVERLRALPELALAPVRRLGPAPDPRDPEAAPPWRLRDDPPGETLEAWLDRRAPAPIDEVAELAATLAERVHEIHAHGAVLRDLNPRHVVLGEDGRVWLTDVGLARVDVLSTRTAASLLLEGSPYAAPELLAHTVVDQRADVYGLGVLLYRALGGELPGGDDAPLLRPPGPAPRIQALRPDVPDSLDALVAQCLAEDPEQRLGSAAELAEILRGRATLPGHVEQVACQACGRDLRVGQRLCTHCGKLAVQFTPAADPAGAYDVVLRKIGEQVQAREHLRQVLSAVTEGPLPPLNFLVGDQRMYSKAERKRLIGLPVRLVTGLDHASAQRLAERLATPGLETRLVASRSSGAAHALTRRQRRAIAAGALAGAALTLATGALVGGSMGVFLALSLSLVTVVSLLVAYASMRRRGRQRTDAPLVALRPAPAALPASD
ncbi:MAG: serine/threonine protein kinase, partial [Myxococcales bacterium]|nr:serine/threonine protein kinase [Myxococcales bacterium]